MHLMNRRGTRGSIVAALVLAGLLAMNSAPPTMERTASAASGAPPVPPGAPIEDSRYANEWPSPNGDLYNTRVAHTLIASTNVSQLGIAWTVPLTGTSPNGADVANPVIANGIVYQQDGASNVLAIREATGQVLWMHHYNSPSLAGPNGVTIADGLIYGVTNTGVFALDATTGKQVWYDAQFGAQTRFDIAPQVAGGKVFVASAVTVGGGIIYALDARTGAMIWRFQTVADPVGRRLPSPTGGAWDPFLIGPDHSVYAGIGNPYLSLQQAETTPSRELYTDSLVKLAQATGKLEWYYQATPNDFHDWDLQISPIYTTAAGHPMVLAAGKAGFVFAFDPASGKLLWKTSVGVHNGHDHDSQLALAGKLQLQPPYTLEPGEVGGVQTNMAVTDGTVYVPVDNLPETFATATARVGTSNFLQAAGEMVALDLATGKQVWATKLPQLALGGATVANDLVFTSTFTGELVALSRKDGSIVWKTQLPAGANAPLAIAGSTVLAGAGEALGSTAHPMLVAYRLGATGHFTATPPGPGQAPGASKFLLSNAAAHTATLILVAGYSTANSGFNFDGAGRGRAIVSIPVGYKVTVVFSNAATLPHSAVVTAYANRTGPSFPPAFPGATTPNATTGAGKGVHQTFTFTATKVGTYAIVCAVPGHAAAGMWDVLKVTPGGSVSASLAAAG